MHSSSSWTCENSLLQDVKLNSPDYRNMDKDKAKDDFLKRIEHYRQQYEPIDEKDEDHLSYIRVINAGRSFYVHNIAGAFVIRTVV